MLLSELVLIAEAVNPLITKVEKLTIDEIIKLAEYALRGDDVTSLLRAKTKSIDEVTTSDQGDVIVNVEFFYRASRYIASVFIEERSGKLKASNVEIEKDLNWGRR